MFPAERPRALFRADASGRMGTGHVVRCTTLARVIVARGWDAVMVGRIPDGLASSVADEGIGVHRLPDDLTPEAEPAYLEDHNLLGETALVLSDHYGLAADWQQAVGGGRRVMAAIDDLADREMTVDLVLNQNLGATPQRYAHLVRPGTAVLTGPRYALLRPEFATLRASLPLRTGEIQRILVFLSGADEHDVTSRAAEAAAATGLGVDVVVGSAYPFLDRLRGGLVAHPHVRIHVNTPAMPQLMAEADITIGAPSSASWERSALSLPGVLVILADNQVEVAGQLEAMGAAEVLGWHHAVTTATILTALAALQADPHRVRAMGLAAGVITDGLGTARVADAILNLATLRALSPRTTGVA